MPRKSKVPLADPEQSKRFVDLAREAEAMDDKEAFDRAVKKVALSPKKKVGQHD